MPFILPFLAVFLLLAPPALAQRLMVFENGASEWIPGAVPGGTRIYDQEMTHTAQAPIAARCDASVTVIESTALYCRDGSVQLTPNALSEAMSRGHAPDRVLTAHLRAIQNARLMRRNMAQNLNLTADGTRARPAPRIMGGGQNAVSFSGFVGDL